VFGNGAGMASVFDVSIVCVRLMAISSFLSLLGLSALPVSDSFDERNSRSHSAALPHLKTDWISALPEKA
jgi:hypothetical protein